MDHAEQGAGGRFATRGAPASSGRWLAVLTLVLAVALMVLLAGQLRAEADLADRVAGHVVIEPGDTLWDVAVATAPAGTDAREQLAELVALNGFDGSAIDAWTVVLLPAR